MARFLDGADDEIQCSDHASLNGLTTGTVAFRWKPNYSGSPGSTKGLYSKSHTATSVALYGAYHYTDGGLYHHLNGGGGLGVGTFSPTSGTWYAFVFLWDGSYVKCYINGSFNGQASTSSGSGSNTRPFFIGAYVYNSEVGKQRGSGDFAEFAVWKNAVLTVDEMIALSKGLTANRIRPEKLSLYCPLWGIG